ncbi:hypothetical protein EDC04DRAFT_1638117 [Pisolithus marmoratus]|nr:hypothetical protein EDC04DRAFT_1638117 [Pisolithus marmoratus]
MGSILTGLAVRTPRLFTTYSSSYFQVMALVLGFPFELFLYRCVSLRAALVLHFGIHGAMWQISAAIFIFCTAIGCLGSFWFVTKPQEEQLVDMWGLFDILMSFKIGGSCDCQLHDRYVWHRKTVCMYTLHHTTYGQSDLKTCTRILLI